MSTCQTAANEFLRQFWSAIYPSASNAQTLAPSTPAQKADKAARMAGYLGKTHEKVAAIVVTAHKSGVDMEKIEIVGGFPLRLARYRLRILMSSSMYRP